MHRPWIKSLKFIVLAAAIGGFAPLAAATETNVPPPGLAKPGISGWQRAEKTGCLVWNDMPQPDEVAFWSGHCANGLAEGPGQLRWVFDRKEECFLGTMKAGRGHGRGVYVWARGEHYQGEVVDGKQTGRLVKRFYEGERYDGDFIDGKRTGRGVAVHANGERYEGEFLDGYRHGRGTLTFPSGEKFVGEFNMGSRGKGTTVPADPNDKRAAPDLRTGTDGCDVVS